MCHSLFLYFFEDGTTYHDMKVDAAGELRFSDVDFMFDDFYERMDREETAKL